MINVNYLLICLFFGTTFLAFRNGADASVPPFFSAGIRFFVGSHEHAARFVHPHSSALRRWEKIFH